METKRKYLTTKLPEGAKPTEWSQLMASRLEDELKVHRFMNCKHYGTCLSYASGLYWQGWSCHWCSLNETHLKEQAQLDKQIARQKAREEMNKL